jgi:hypothetical protein
MLATQVTMADDERVALARELLAVAPRPAAYGGHYLECPGCDLLVHHADAADHASRCASLKDQALARAVEDAPDA